MTMTTTAPELITGACPGTAWAWAHIANEPEGRRGGNLNSEAVLLGLAWLTDLDLASPQGYSQVTADRVARLTGLARSTVERTLRGLAVAGAIELIRTHAAVRYVETGQAAGAIHRGSRILGYRLPESAFTPSIEVGQ